MVSVSSRLARSPWRCAATVGRGSESPPFFRPRGVSVPFCSPREDGAALPSRDPHGELAGCHRKRWWKQTVYRPGNWGQGWTLRHRLQSRRRVNTKDGTGRHTARVRGHCASPRSAGHLATWPPGPQTRTLRQGRHAGVCWADVQAWLFQALFLPSAPTSPLGAAAACGSRSRGTAGRAEP